MLAVLLATNLLIAHEGRLLQNGDVPAEGSHTLTFSVYKVPLNGDAVWHDDFHVNCDKAGMYSVNLGDTDAHQKAITEADLGPEPRWLGITVDAAGELTPRLPIGVVPLAARALV